MTARLFTTTDDRRPIRWRFSMAIDADALAGDSGIITTGGDGPSSWTATAMMFGPMIGRTWWLNLLLLILIDATEIVALCLGRFLRDQLLPAPFSGRGMASRRCPRSPDSDSKQSAVADVLDLKLFRRRWPAEWMDNERDTTFESGANR